MLSIAQYSSEHAYYWGWELCNKEPSKCLPFQAKVVITWRHHFGSFYTPSRALKSLNRRPGERYISPTVPRKIQVSFCPLSMRIGCLCVYNGFVNGLQSMTAPGCGAKCSMYTVATVDRPPGKVQPEQLWQNCYHLMMYALVHVHGPHKFTVFKFNSNLSLGSNRKI